MTRRIWAISFAMLAAGCASQSQSPKSTAQLSVDRPATATSAGSVSANRATDATPMAVHHSAAAGALAFDPPVLIGEPRIDLSRDDRAPSAFFGYETLSTTYLDVHTDDRQFFDTFDGRFERRAISDKISVSYR